MTALRFLPFKFHYNDSSVYNDLVPKGHAIAVGSITDYTWKRNISHQH